MDMRFSRGFEYGMNEKQPKAGLGSKMKKKVRINEGEREDRWYPTVPWDFILSNHYVPRASTVNSCTA